MKLSVIIPVYNEEKTLKSILNKVIDLGELVGSAGICAGDCHDGLSMTNG